MPFSFLVALVLLALELVDGQVEDKFRQGLFTLLDPAHTRGDQPVLVDAGQPELDCRIVGNQR